MARRYSLLHQVRSVPRLEAFGGAAQRVGVHRLPVTAAINPAFCAMWAEVNDRTQVAFVRPPGLDRIWGPRLHGLARAGRIPLRLG